MVRLDAALGRADVLVRPSEVADVVFFFADDGRAADEELADEIVLLGTTVDEALPAVEKRSSSQRWLFSFLPLPSRAWVLCAKARTGIHLPTARRASLWLA